MADIDQILDVVNTVANTIKTAASLPGINMLPYANTIAGAIDLLQLAVQAGRDITPYVSAIKNTFGDGAKLPTDEELAALDAKIAALRAELQAPLPEKDPDEPE